MPVLEAMVCGASVLASNSTALAEVAGDAARLADLQLKVVRSKSLQVVTRTFDFMI